MPESELRSQCYISLDVTDRAGVLAAVTKVFGDNNVSIRSLEQDGEGGEARLLFITHEAREGDVRSTLDGLAGLESVERIGGVMRIIGDTA